MAKVATVPARPIRRDPSGRRASSGMASIAPSSATSAIARASASCSGDAGSLWRVRSATRTQPTCIEYAESPVAVARTTSVDPPPMSSTTSAPMAGSRPSMAPAKDSRPSSAPERISASTPVILDAAAKKAGPFAASRAAEVAANRPCSTPAASMRARYSPSTAKHRSTASSASRPVASTPWPSRVIRISRTTVEPWESMMRSRVELVPQSMAQRTPEVTRLTLPRVGHPW